MQIFLHNRSSLCIVFIIKPHVPFRLLSKLGFINVSTKNNLGFLNKLGNEKKKLGNNKDRDKLVNLKFKIN